MCKNTQIAKVLYEWLAEGASPAGVPPADIPELRNADGQVRTIRVDSKVVQETDTEGAKSDEVAWMRFTLDTVGKLDWPRDLAGSLRLPRAVRGAGRKARTAAPSPRAGTSAASSSVGMLTEGWDCNTVTHIVGLRPFMSQLLCEQVVGRGLRRRDYEVGEDGKLTEEVAKILGVPFEVIPFKQAATRGQRSRSDPTSRRCRRRPSSRSSFRALSGTSSPSATGSPWTGTASRPCSSTR